jgi:cysteine desulfurase
MTLHLLHGPKGVGALYLREGVKLEPLIEGDDREKGLRAGSQNIPGVVGFASAVELMKKEDLHRMAALRDDLVRKLLNIRDTNLNGPTGNRRLCNNINVSFLRVEGESLTLHADMNGLIMNTGSACYSSKLERVM